MSGTLPLFAADYSPSAAQNQQPILARLLQLLPPQGAALEIACGTGQHAASFASHLPGWTWQPTDTHTDSFPSICHYAQLAGAANVLAPQQLDVCAERWFAQPLGADAPPAFDLIFCANMLHIAPWAACVGLMQGSARHLAPGGRLVTYGPYLEQEVSTAPSNLGFDASLRARDPGWGVRWREEVEAVAHQAGLRLLQRHTMPANNLLLVWARAQG